MINNEIRLAIKAIATSKTHIGVNNIFLNDILSLIVNMTAKEWEYVLNFFSKDPKYIEYKEKFIANTEVKLIKSQKELYEKLSFLIDILKIDSIRNKDEIFISVYRIFSKVMIIGNNYIIAASMSLKALGLLKPKLRTNADVMAIYGNIVFYLTNNKEQVKMVSSTIPISELDLKQLKNEAMEHSSKVYGDIKIPEDSIPTEILLSLIRNTKSFESWYKKSDLPFSLRDIAVSMNMYINGLPSFSAQGATAKRNRSIYEAAAINGVMFSYLILSSSILRSHLKELISNSFFYNHEERIRLQKAVEYHHEGKYAESIFFACSTIEGVIRRNLSFIPPKIYSSDMEDFMGTSESTMKPLFEDLILQANEGIAKDIATYSFEVMAKRSGLNIRNNVFHGLSFAYENESNSALLIDVIMKMSTLVVLDNKHIASVIPLRIMKHIASQQKLNPIFQDLISINLIAINR